MELTDLLPLEKWVEIEKEIYRRSGLDASVFDTKGYRITGYREWANPLCPVIKNNDKGQSFICAVAHMNVASQAQQTRSPVIEDCDAGLVKACVPIMVGETYMGTLCGCGKIRDDGEVETFLVNKITGIDEETLEPLAAEVQRISSEDLKAMLSYMTKMVDAAVTEYQNKNPGE
ncbi:MAG: PocR ligand-binding domain-containing protein [Deltaproteobacteria bacterium]|nr:PocR ligand-binding domain-containing protein [Deltaproteobacteria bacterium]